MGKQRKLSVKEKLVKKGSNEGINVRQKVFLGMLLISKHRDQGVIQRFIKCGGDERQMHL